jgi:hypothetical protein
MCAAVADTRTSDELNRKYIWDNFSHSIPRHPLDATPVTRGQIIRWRRRKYEPLPHAGLIVDLTPFQTRTMGFQELVFSSEYARQFSVKASAKAGGQAAPGVQVSGGLTVGYSFHAKNQQLLDCRVCKKETTEIGLHEGEEETFQQLVQAKVAAHRGKFRRGKHYGVVISTTRAQECSIFKGNDGEVAYLTNVDAEVKSVVPAVEGGVKLEVEDRTSVKTASQTGPFQDEIVAYQIRIFRITWIGKQAETLGAEEEEETDTEDDDEGQPLRPLFFNDQGLPIDQKGKPMRHED